MKRKEWRRMEIHEFDCAFSIWKKEIREAQAAGEMRRGFLSWTGWTSQRNTLVIQGCYKFFDTFNNILPFIEADCSVWDEWFR